MPIEKLLQKRTVHARQRTGEGFQIYDLGFEIYSLSCRIVFGHS